MEDIGGIRTDVQNITEPDYMSYISVYLSMPHYILFYLTIHPHASLYLLNYKVHRRC